MSKFQQNPLNSALYNTPFCRAYWRDAASELKNARMLCTAAILIAVRVALKSLAIPIAPPTLSLNLGFFVNALGAGIFGPVVALIAAAISDTIGAVLFPQGVYFFPFIFTEMAGSLIFALFLYRAPRSALRITLSRFCVCFLVNIVIQSPIMLWYYHLILGKSYALFDLPRICKNLVMFPIESILLTGFLNIMDPITYRMGLTHEPPQKKQITRRTIAFILVLFVLGAASTGAYYVYDYNTRNHTNDFKGTERADFNRTLHDNLGSDGGDLVLVNNIYSKIGQETETVTYTIYALDPDAGITLGEEWDMLNSKAVKLDYLTVVQKYTVLLNKNTLALAGEPAEAG